MKRKFKLIDQKFKKHKKQYILQSAMTVGVVAVVLMTLDIVSDGVIVASIGASSTIAYGRPHTKTAAPKYLIGSYIAGVIIGWICSTAIVLLEKTAIPPDNFILMAVFGSLAVGLTMFAMVTMNIEHPPAAALALGFVLDGFTLISAIVALVGITLISLVKELLKRFMFDLY